MRVNIICVAVAAAFAMPVYAQSSNPATPRGAQSPAAGAPARSESPPRDTAAGSSMTFKSIDANKDGHVSRDEAKNSNELNRRFSELDRDGDGKLSAQELSGFGNSAPSTTGSGASGSSANPMERSPRTTPSDTKRGY